MDYMYSTTKIAQEKEEELQMKFYVGISDCGGDITVYQLVEKYVSLKVGVRESTKAGYRTVLSMLSRNLLRIRELIK